jgi:hypothetical protein
MATSQHLNLDAFMKKPKALANALQTSGASVVAMQPPAVPPTNASPPRARSAVPPSRQGTKSITFHQPEAVRRQLKLLAAELDRTVDDLCAEAFNLLFATYRKPEIARRATHIEARRAECQGKH